MSTDNIPEAVKAIIKEPGFYVFVETHTHWYFEVDADKNIYQIAPDTGLRDGLLRKDGWRKQAFPGTVRCIGKVFYPVKRDMLITTFYISKDVTHSCCYKLAIMKRTEDQPDQVICECLLPYGEILCQALNKAEREGRL